MYSIRDILFIFSFNLISFSSRLLNKSASKYNCRVLLFDKELKELKNKSTSSSFDNTSVNFYRKIKS